MEETFNILSYKSTWQKMVETMDHSSGTNGASLTQAPEDVRSIVTNARSEWTVYPDPNLPTSQDDAVYPNPTGADASEQQMVRALLSRSNLLLICNQLQDVLVSITANSDMHGSSYVHLHNYTYAHISMHLF